MRLRRLRPPGPDASWLDTRAGLVTGVLGMAAPGPALFAMAAFDARDLLEGWGTERLWFGAGMLAYPLGGAFMLVLSVIILRERVLGRPGDPGEHGRPRPAKWLLAAGVAAVVSVRTAFTDRVIAGRLEAEGYRRCEGRSPGRGFRWDDWVRDGATCERRPGRRETA